MFRIIFSSFLLSTFMFGLYNVGQTVSINDQNITMDVLLGEIERIVNSGTKINIDYHVDEILDESQQNEIQDYYIHEADSDSIDDAKDYFENEYEEDELRLMKIKIFSDLAN